jgi:hypothetical protein
MAAYLRVEKSSREKSLKQKRKIWYEQRGMAYHI